MKLMDKLYVVKIAVELAKIVKNIEGEPTPIDYLRYNNLKSKVAQDIFTKNKPSEIYKEFFFNKELEDYIPNKG